MAKKKPTQLDIDIAASIRAGVSYGQYVAMKHCTTLPPSVTAPEGTAHECLYCKMIFYRSDKYQVKYCSEWCREQMKLENAKKRKSAKMLAVLDPKDIAILA